MQRSDPEVIDVRTEERLDVDRLEPYLRGVLPRTDGPFSLRQFSGGHANLTYLAAFGDHEYVLRRPPLGPVPARAHDMRREHAVLSQLYRTFPLAPQSYALCTDHAIIGSDFVVEERKSGIAVRRDLPPAIECSEPLKRRIGEALIDTLAALHRIDVNEAGLADLGHPDGYVQRQLNGWIERWNDARTGQSADASQVTAWLRERLPPSSAVGIVHNDYKLDNMLLDGHDPSRITALLDWDMCTIGDPLMDLGYLLALWAEPADPPAARAGAMPTWHAGFPTRDDAVQRYAALTGFDVSHLRWYYVFNIFRFAVILQQIYKRYAVGQTHDKRFSAFGAQADALIAMATSLRRG